MSPQILDEIFTSKLTRLASMLAHNAGVEDGDHVLLHAHSGAESLMQKTAEACYERGASHVNVVLCDPVLVRTQILAHKDQKSFYFPESERAAWQEIMDKDGCVIQLRTDPDPRLFSDISNEYGLWSQAMWENRQGFFTRGVAGCEFPWVLFYVPTQSMAEQIYPEVPKEKALGVYWDAIFDMTLATAEDALVQLQESDKKLHARAAALDALEIKTLHFIGENTDLTVGLSGAARWLAGSRLTKGNKKRRHTVNMPTYEVYTTPDWRTVSGGVLITKEVVIDGTVVKDGRVTFTDGRVTKIEASEGKEALEALTNRDEGATRLGEIALVGLDSPTAVRKRVFQSMLLDENAACHFAFGSAYLAAIEHETEIDEDVIEELGINRSGIHHDVMISDEQTSVTAATRNGKVVELIRDGHWTKDFQ